jgi:hypothetical protein
MGQCVIDVGRFEILHWWAETPPASVVWLHGIAFYSASSYIGNGTSFEASHIRWEPNPSSALPSPRLYVTECSFWAGSGIVAYHPVYVAGAASSPELENAFTCHTL